jgi:hypothetical protein
LLNYLLRLNFEVERHFKNNLFQLPHFTEEENELVRGETIWPRSYKEFGML